MKLLAVAGEPVLPADDEALLRGRAAFETLRVYGGVPFRIDDHLERMEASAARLDVRWPGGFAELADQALSAAAVSDAVLRLYLTPGREGSGKPCSFALVSALPDDLEERRARGIALISLLGVRAEAPWLLGGVKSTSYAVNMAAMVLNYLWFLYPAGARTCTPATAKAVETKAARVIWIASDGHASLNMAFTGSMLMALPFTQSKPAGLFIHALADTTKMPDKIPDTLTTIPESQCIHLFNLFHP